MGQREILDAIILQDRGGALVTPPAGCTAVQMVGTGLKTVNEAGVAADLGGALPGMYPVTDSYAVTNDSPALQDAIDRADANRDGVVWIPAGSHRFKTGITCRSGVSIEGAGRRATTLIIDDSAGNIGDLFTLTNTVGVSFRNFFVTASSLRGAGAIWRVKGGDTTAPLNGFVLRENLTSVQRCDAELYFDAFDADDNNPYGTWLLNARDCVWRNGHAQGFGLDLNCAFNAAAQSYGASHYFADVWIYNSTKKTTGAGFRIRGTGDFQMRGCQTWGMTGLRIDPPAGGRISTGRFVSCFFDAADGHVAEIIPSSTVQTFGDLDFSGGWFAGAGAGGVTGQHGLLINSPSVKGVRFRGTQFFANSGAGAVVTGSGAGPHDIEFDGCEFSGNAQHGLRLVAGSRIDVRGGRATQGTLGFASAQPIGLQIDAGITDVSIDGIDLRDNATPFVDASTGTKTIRGIR